jgi:hypothetical protein
MMNINCRTFTFSHFLLILKTTKLTMVRIVRTIVKGSAVKELLQMTKGIRKG